MYYIKMYYFILLLFANSVKAPECVVFCVQLLSFNATTYLFSCYKLNQIKCNNVAVAKYLTKQTTTKKPTISALC